ncbi:hypothetical protein C9374_010952 [Naegleria lovaniensis]|uniref:Glycosyltransferase n=1 Tax=Naegleria lovaniensis TaxID=51637 RepID=A0AA88GF00_NAELO|nr:uncharacterized protein C9374_010952 [Naegleria lovaniensis]KAG2374382.1 hypothetical protein C9374_010952 [Naegleria lovaniensis]
MVNHHHGSTINHLIVPSVSVKKCNWLILACLVTFSILLTTLMMIYFKKRNIYLHSSHNDCTTPLTTTINLINRYTPPKVPNEFQNFIFSHDRHSKSNENIVIPSSQKIEHYNTRMNNPSLFSSHYNCIKQLPDHVNRTSLNNRYSLNWKSLYTSCVLENVCLNRRGEWILYLHHEHEREKFNEQILVLTSSLRLIMHESIKFKIHTKLPPHKASTPSHQYASEKDDTSIFKMSKQFSWIQTPTFAFSRYATSNVGHLIMDNLFSVFNLMANFEYVNSNHFLLFLDDPFNKETGSLPRAGHSPERAEEVSLQWAKFFSSQKPLQLCFDRFTNSYYIHYAPCRQDNVEKSIKEQLPREEGDEIQTCFSSLFIGSVESHYFDFYGRETIFPLFRNYLLNQVGLLEPKKYSHENHHAVRRHTLKIAIQKKPISSKHKDSIINTFEIAQHFNEKKNEILTRLNTIYGNDIDSSHRGVAAKKFHSIEIIELKLEELNAMEQLHFFKELDVYITTQGSASYMSMFMLNPTSLLFFSPLCRSETFQCSDYNIRIHKTFSNVRTISLNDHLDMIECVKENIPNGIGYKVQKVEPPGTVYYYGDCHLRLNVEKFYALVLEELENIHTSSRHWT